MSKQKKIISSSTEDKKVLLVILDGFGEGKATKGNAITQAKMPFFNGLKKDYPVTLLKASGNAVGLPAGYQGNSEVGHFTIGSGRITWQSFEAINQSIKDKSFFTKPELLKTIERAKKNKGAVHLVGMISDQGVHAHINHLFTLMKLAKAQNMNKIFIHCILDGRDVPERSAGEFIEQIKKKIKSLHCGKIATLIGRYYAMDRDSNWDRTQKAYELLVEGKGEGCSDAQKAIKKAYKEGAETDYYIPPYVIDPEGKIKSGDSVIFFNYRTDRARQLTEVFVNKKFDQFERKHSSVNFVAMGPYTEKAPVVFPCPPIKNNLSEILSQHKMLQLRVAETEKYAHVTYFFNSQRENPNPGEDRLMIPSPKCPSYAEQPEMSAEGVTQKAISEIRKKKYAFIAMNYANPDLVGHSGNLKATIQSCAIIDKCFSRLIPEAIKNEYTILVTADHGKAEEMLYPDGSACPSHTTNKVIGILVSSPKLPYTLKKGKGLQDIAPTILELMGIQKPKEMTGQSLLEEPLPINK